MQWAASACKYSMEMVVSCIIGLQRPLCGIGVSLAMAANSGEQYRDREGVHCLNLAEHAAKVGIYHYIDSQKKLF